MLGLVVVGRIIYKLLVDQIQDVTDFLRRIQTIVGAGVRFGCAHKDSHASVILYAGEPGFIG